MLFQMHWRSMKKVIQSIDDGMPEDFYSIDLMTHMSRWEALQENQ